MQTILVAPNVISTFRTLDCRQNVYWGSSSSPPDERGGPAHLESKAYGLSWPLVSLIFCAQQLDLERCEAGHEYGRIRRTDVPRDCRSCEMSQAHVAGIVDRIRPDARLPHESHRRRADGPVASESRPRN